jgi:hypothetical protein
LGLPVESLKNDFDWKYKKFFSVKSDENREIGGGISLCYMYSLYLINGVKPKLINKIFQANGLNFGMKEIIING